MAAANSSLIFGAGGGSLPQRAVRPWGRPRRHALEELPGQPRSQRAVVAGYGRGLIP